MNAILKIEDLAVYNGEPTVQDLRLAEALGFDRDRDIRKLIARNMDELRRYGEVCATVAQTSPSGGRPSNEYWLNEPQALLVAIKSDARSAADVREQLIRVFMAWRRGPVRATESGATAPEDREGRALRMVTEARLIFGRAAAARLWAELGLPPVPSALPDTEPEQCLDHLLEWRTQAGTVGELLRAALAGDEAAAAALLDAGLRCGEGCFTVANAHPAILRCYRGTRWRQPYRFLRRLEGAIEAKPMRYGRNVVARGVELPAFYADDETLQ